MFCSKAQKRISYVIFAIYLLLLVWLILFKFSISFHDLAHIRNINLIPFGDSAVINGRISFGEILWNILVFIPLGVYICIFKQDWTFVKKAVPCFLLSLLFEIIQYVFAIGASDITDIIGNTLGGITGIAVFALFRRFFREKCITVINSIGLTVEVLAVFMLGILLVANR